MRSPPCLCSDAHAQRRYLGQSRKADLVVAHKTYRSTLEIPMLRANLTMRDEVDFLAAWSCPNAEGGN